MPPLASSVSTTAEQWRCRAGVLGSRPAPPYGPGMSVVGTASDEDRLKRIEFVTDTSLAQLDVNELLAELLVRVRTLLPAGPAAVLPLDPATDELVATAAQGIEEEVRQGVRIPIGKGFAGRIAA